MMKTNNYKREILSFINKYKAHILVLIAILGMALLGCEDKSAGEAQEYYRFTSIVAGGLHTIGIAEDGTLWSWGYNSNGQLGDGAKRSKSIPVRVQQGGTTWKAVVAGKNHTVGIAEDGTLLSWGWNLNGQLGDGTTIGRTMPVRVQKIGTTWKAVAAGGTHTVGIAEDGTLWSWGENASGQLGDGSTTDKSIPVRVQKIGTTLKVVSAGFNHIVGIDIDGTLWSWGANGRGQLGDGSTTDKSTPVRVKQAGRTTGTFVNNTTKWKAVSAGEHHTVAIDIGGTLWSWGRNDNGQLGDGTKENKSTPVRVKQAGGTTGTFVNNTTKWEVVSAGDKHTVGIAEDGSLWSWGKNDAGQLGLGNLGIDARDPITQISLPRQVGSQKWKAVSAGNNYTVGLAEDGSLWSWGLNLTGELGDGTKIGKNTPVKIQIPK